MRMSVIFRALYICVCAIEFIELKLSLFGATIKRTLFILCKQREKNISKGKYDVADADNEKA